MLQQCQWVHVAEDNIEKKCFLLWKRNSTVDWENLFFFFLSQMYQFDCYDTGLQQAESVFFYY